MWFRGDGSRVSGLAFYFIFVILLLLLMLTPKTIYIYIYILYVRHPFIHRFARNEFVERAARLGVKPGTLLTQREWNAIRRRIRRRPRRFSPNFIDDEFKKLQNYRVHVRMLQTTPDPSFATRLGFDYEVPKPIAVGSPISAIAQRSHGSKTTSPVQRGSVLSFSHGFYVVQLTGGIALLPDFMVARHGPSEVLIPAPRASLVGMREAVVEESGPTEPSASWSGPGPFDGRFAPVCWTISSTRYVFWYIASPLAECIPWHRISPTSDIPRTKAQHSHSRP